MKGINRMSVCVENMEMALEFYRDILGMEIIKRMDIDGKIAAANWGTADNIGAHVTFLQPPTHPAILELIEFRSPPDFFIRQPERWFETGLYGIALRVKNLEQEYANLTAKGYSFLSPPCSYRADWVNVEIREAIAIGPGCVLVPLIQRLSNPVQISGRYGDFTDSSQIVDNIDEAERFYCDVCGLPLLFDKVLPAGMVNEILAVPIETKIRMALLGQPGLPFVECIQYIGESVPVERKKRRQGRIHPGYGLFMITLELSGSEDFKAVCQKAGEKGYPVVSGPSPIRDGIYPGIISMIITGPENIMVRFMQDYPHS